MHVEMRKEPRVLEHTSDCTFFSRHVHAGSGIEQHLAFEDEPAALRSEQSREQCHDGRFTGAGSTEQGGHSRRGRDKLDVELERSTPQSCLEFEHSAAEAPSQGACDPL